MSSLLEDAKKRTRRPKARRWSDVIAALNENNHMARMLLAQDIVTDQAVLLKVFTRGEELLEELSRSLGNREEDSE